MKELPFLTIYFNYTWSILVINDATVVKTPLSGDPSPDAVNNTTIQIRILGLFCQVRGMIFHFYTLTWSLFCKAITLLQNDMITLGNIKSFVKVATIIRCS